MEEITFKEGLEIARQYGMEAEYLACIADDFTPYEALEDWDLI
jgi:hypothetical protein